MNEYIFDIEADGLNPTKIHVLSVGTVEKGIIDSTDDYDRMRKFFTNEKLTIIGHNIILFDIVHIERLLDIKVKCKIIDTLPLSWYLEFDRSRHGLESWGETFGVPKPKVDDWHNLTYEDYKHRCEEDVKINIKLWERLKKKLDKLYEGDYQRLIDYLNFKMHCAMLQERSRWKLDVEKAQSGLDELTKEKEEKINVLASVMPKVAKKTKKHKPKKPYKQDGSLSAIGERWFTLLKEHNLPEDYDGVVEIIAGYSEPNPNSHDQVKKWLYNLGWKPETFKFVRNKETNEVKQIPQINLPHGQGVCSSIKKLFKKEPNLEVLDGLSVLTHRISILDGFLKAVDDEGYVQARIQGLTNTMRFKHAVCVNLPGVKKPYGELIRGCLIADDGYELCGSDLKSLEDRLKQHYIWRFDKKYVREMMVPGFDPHLDLAVAAGALTEGQAKAHKGGREDYSEVRHTYKQTNYSCQYGAGGATVARAAGLTKREGDKLVEAYWKRNWAVKAVPKTIKTKKEFGSMWLLNPISNLWYSLRTEKDIFSTLVQGSGDYCFSTWKKHVLSRREQLTGNFHDELVLHVKKGYRKQAEQLLRWAIRETNKELRLNRELDIDVQFGECYADIH